MSAQRDVCQGYANCILLAPDYLDLADDDMVEVLKPSVDPEDVAMVDEAVKSCPVAALRME